ncbi:DUF1788 domain-containing protein [Marinomonas algarum]|uniref:DUF1788 domain-containing protein n=1 Tax=Marinomonas algarum TaxID=2883105 RepID=A0A9X1IJC6_9GAMM|nr:DUF1788 domain-containing protein [Marinomonas algarum]MCB5160350.1 DUF1788 domain-containing protein [Marinomonas algarum]
MDTLKVLKERLDQVQDRIESSSFLESQGLGNEIGFWIFDYPAEHEIEVREHLLHITERLNKRNYNFLNLNVFEVITSLLDSRKLFDKACKRELEAGSEKLLQSLKGPLSQDKIVKYIVDAYQPQNYDFVILSGIGSTWPLVRSHELLSALQDVMGRTPLVLFYPGTYSGFDLHPFGLIKSKNYYRAFKLVP